MRLLVEGLKEKKIKYKQIGIKNMMWVYSIIILIIAGLVIYWLKARKQDGGTPSSIDMSGLSENGSQSLSPETPMPESNISEAPEAPAEMPEMPEMPEAPVETPSEMGGTASEEEKPM